MSTAAIAWAATPGSPALRTARHMRSLARGTSNAGRPVTVSASSSRTTWAVAAGA
jgi:hypothetical protein